jgi:hypothetical protein
LTEKGLASKTIKNHVDNVNFYLNDYLIRYEPICAVNGCGEHVNAFLGDWFIRKTAWVSRSAIKEYAVSFKKFYAYMLEKGAVEQTDYDFLKHSLKSVCLIGSRKLTKLTAVLSGNSQFLLSKQDTSVV